MSVLIVVTNTKTIGRPEVESGWFLPSVVYPYHAFTSAGLKVTFCSPLGGEAPVDPESVGLWDHPVCQNTLADENFTYQLKNTVPVRAVDPSKYKVIFFAGGHGPMFDCANNEILNKITATIYENGGIVGSVCHGTVGLLNVKLSSGDYLVNGKQLTGLPNKEVKRLPFSNAFPFSLQDKLVEQGADFQEGIPVRENQVVCGRIVTGQNPNSSEGLGELIVGIMKTRSQVLMVLTNTKTVGRPEVQSGWFLPSVVYPYMAFTGAGYEVTFCSALGGDCPVDPESVGLWDHPVCMNTLENQTVMDKIKNSVSIRDIDPSKYRVIFFAGGHGPMFDCANNEVMNKVTAKIYESGGIVGAICHGGAGLLNVKLSNGDYLVKGHQVTALANKEVERLPFSYAFPFSLQDKLTAQGADFQEGIPVRENQVVSGRIVTGQNPNSSEGLGELIIGLLKKE